MPTEFDTDLFLLNCGNATVDLRTGEAREQRREDLISRVAGVDYVPAAKCPTWERCLKTWTGHSQEMVHFLRRAVGYAATGSTQEQCLFFLHGAGANGKTTFLTAILDVLGDYGMQAVSDLLLVKQGQAHPTELADLFGRRMIATVEVEDGRRMAESLMKQLTGGDKVRARKMRQDFWEFSPTHKIFLAANHKPTIRGQDYAVWRRIKMIPFSVTIGEEEKDPKLAEKLRAEGSGILNWIVAGALEWQQNGLGEPEEVKQATASYRGEMDVIGEFLAENCLVGPEYRCRASELYAVFREWAKRTGEYELSQRRFGAAMTAKDFERRENHGFWYLGLAKRDNATFNATNDNENRLYS